MYINIGFCAYSDTASYRDLIAGKPERIKKSAARDIPGREKRCLKIKIQFEFISQNAINEELSAS